MKKILCAVLTVGLLFTYSIVPIVHADDVVQTSKAIGFEENNIYSVSGGGITRTIVEDTDNGSKYALKVECTGAPSDLTVPVAVKEGQKYLVSARIKPIKTGDSTGRAVMRVLLHQSSGSYPATILTYSGGSQTMAIGRWHNVSAEISATTTATENFMFRFGDNNTNSGSEYIIDDIIITQITEKKYIVDINFDNESLYNSGTCTTVTAEADFSTGVGGYINYFSRNGGKGAEINGVYGGLKLINMKKVLLKPNTTYKISYDMLQMKTDAIGKAIRMGINRGGYHKRSDETTDAKRQLSNVYSDVYEIKDTSWHTVTQYITTSDINAFDEYGYCDLYFDVWSDSTCTKRIQGAWLKCQIDNLKVEEVNVLNGADFESGKLPKTFESSSANYNSEKGYLEVEVATADDKSDIMFGTGMETGTDYVLSYYIKGTEGLKIQALYNGIIETGVGAWGNIGSQVTLSDSWVQCTSVVNYTGSGAVTYPSIIFRPKENTGTYMLSDVRLMKKSDTYVYAQADNGLYSGENTIVNFKDNTGVTPTGYTFNIYSKDLSGNKVIYWSGMTTQKAVSYKVSAPVGTKLYATVVAMASDNSQSAEYETELGTVAVLRKLSVNLSFADGDDIVGVVNVSNDATQRNMILYLAQYDDDNRLVAVKISDKKTIAANEDVSFEIRPDEVKGTQIKLMAWDEMLHPYTAVKPYEE